MGGALVWGQGLACLIMVIFLVLERAGYLLSS